MCVCACAHDVVGVPHCVCAREREGGRCAHTGTVSRPTTAPRAQRCLWCAHIRCRAPEGGAPTPPPRSLHPHLSLSLARTHVCARTPARRGAPSARRCCVCAGVCVCARACVRAHGHTHWVLCRWRPVGRGVSLAQGGLCWMHVLCVCVWLLPPGTEAAMAWLLTWPGGGMVGVAAVCCARPLAAALAHAAIELRSLAPWRAPRGQLMCGAAAAR